jgi:hypothetical protein
VGNRTDKKRQIVRTERGKHLRLISNKSNSEEEGGDNHAGGSGEGGSADELEVSSSDVSVGGHSPDILSIASFEVEISVIGLEEGESELSALEVTSIGSPSPESISGFLKFDIC